MNLDVEPRIDALDGRDHHLPRQRPGEAVQLLPPAGILELQQDLRSRMHQSEHLAKETVEDLVGDLAADMPGADEVRLRGLRRDEPRIVDDPEIRSLPLVQRGSDVANAFIQELLREVET